MSGNPIWKHIWLARSAIFMIRYKSTSSVYNCFKLEIQAHSCCNGPLKWELASDSNLSDGNQTRKHICPARPRSQQLPRPTLKQLFITNQLSKRSPCVVAKKVIIWVWIFVFCFDFRFLHVCINRLCLVLPSFIKILGRKFRAK